MPKRCANIHKRKDNRWEGRVKVGKYMVKSGTVYLDSLNSGDKFRDDSLILYDIVPGEKYELKFFDCE